MKKIILSVGALIAVISGVFAQSTPRTVLFEHFTQASCGPCATANPGIRTYTSTTTVNLAHINYQVSWPGVDPMNAHNPADPAARVTLYGVTGVPNSVIDGNHFNGAPINFSGGWTNTTMTTREAVMSPFILEPTATLNDALDTISIDMKIKASDVTSGTYVAHIVVVEDEINFASAPGSNGEKDFYNVVKKMLPSNTGTSIAASWAVNDSVTISQSWALANVYDKSRLSVVVWVQNTTTKEVMQAAKVAASLPPGLIVADVSAKASHALPSNLCDDAFTPKMIVKNNSSNTVDTFQVSYTLNNGTPVVEDVYTTLAGGASYTHTFTGITLSLGSNTISYSVNTDGDQTSDLSDINNTTTDEIVNLMPTAAFATFHSEDFESGTVSNAIEDNPDDIYAFVTNTAGGYSSSSNSYLWAFYAINPGKKASVIWEKLDFSGGANYAMTFDYAYAQYQNENDQLKIYASLDCGATWSMVYSKGGSSLTTAPASTSSFKPSSSQWKSEEVSLALLAGQPEVMLKMEGVSAYGNNLYVDNINIAEVVDNTGIDADASMTDVMVFPNPADNETNVTVQLSKAEIVRIKVYNALGVLVQEKDLGYRNAGLVQEQLNLSELNSGIYFVNVTAGDNTISRKVTLK